MQLTASSRVLEHNRRWYWVVSASMCISLRDSKPVLLHDYLDSMMQAMDDPPLLDMGMPKPFTEWLLSGRFCAADNQMVTAGKTRVKLADQEKSLNVFGDRQWTAGLPSSPQPFVAMPLRYSYSYGGQNYDLNPAGKGFQTKELPNIELLSETTESAKKRYTPAGYSPLPVHCPQRAKYQGTYDKRYMENYFPGYPQDMDWRLFMSAPDDQWFSGFLRGNEAYQLEGLSPRLPQIKGNLPGLVPRCVIRQRADDNGGYQLADISLNLDTVWFFPEAVSGSGSSQSAEDGVVQLIWRGVTEACSDDAEEISHVLLGYEYAENPQPAAHYRNALLRRIENPSPLEDSLNTKDLIPPDHKTALQMLTEDVQGAAGGGKNAFSENMQRKTAAVNEEIKKHLSEQIEDAKKRIDQADIAADKKADLIASLDAAPAVQEPDPMLSVLDKLLPGVASGSSSIDFSEFTFEKMDSVIREIDDLAEARKRAVITDVNPQIKRSFEDILRQMDRGDEAVSATGSAVEPQHRKALLQRLESLSAEEQSATPQRTELPRLNEQEIRRQLIAADAELIKARQAVHQQSANPMLAGSESLSAVKARLLALEERLKGDVADTLSQLRDQFMSGYVLSAHFGADGLSPHSDDAERRQQLMRCVNTSAALSRQDWACLDLSGCKLDGLDFSGCLMEQVNLRGASCVGTNFTGAVLARADLSGADLTDAVLDGSNIGSAICHGTRFVRCSVKNTILSKADLFQAIFDSATIVMPDALETSLYGVSFRNASVRGWAFLEVTIEGCVFEQAELETCSFVHSSLINSRFNGAVMPSSVWVGCRLEGVDFTSADMSRNCFVSSDEDFVFKQLNFTDAVLNMANLQNIRFEKAVFANARLEYTNFSGAALKSALFDGCRSVSARFQKADLSHASFNRSDLMESIMTRARLTDTNFRGANMYGTDFIQAIVKGSDFSGANLDATVLRDWRPS
ncbi:MULTISPECIES: DUF2169 family type VI secretion system accessory protein [unclassified Thalassolituus]|uniref:DUF2169 family type VI secretion system accessory protein n=1 Tax=unclassified Thalassolituus TaxID=2624967 RepID=UPI0025E342BE|nr:MULTISPECIES: DUF2169 domain-containing protein [unclassified Thalassolituus]|tara:strand:+ start:2732 stop:5635 length:2904 start_codon:yes stop_codon:yes gene_type:complete